MKHWKVPVTAFVVVEARTATSAMTKADKLLDQMYEECKRKDCRVATFMQDWPTDHEGTEEYTT
jgi:hypothetical protein